MGVNDEKIQSILDGRDVGALVGLINDREVPEDERPRIILSALSQLESLLYEGLPELVIQVCVGEPEQTAEDARHWFVHPWLRREGYYHRPEVITALISRLQSEVGDKLIAAIETAWTIGYRDDLLQAELVRIAGLSGERHQNEEAEGYALAVLSDMVYPKAGDLSRALGARLNRIGHLTEPDLWTARHVAPLQMLPAITQAARPKHPPFAAVWALLSLAVRFPESVHEVWEAFKSLDDDTQFLFSSTATDLIDLEEVGQYLIAEVTSTFQNINHRNPMPPTNLLLKANLANQIRVFRPADKARYSNLRELLKGPAVKPTGNTGHFNTSETFKKEAAWDVILRFGFHEAREWLPEAMADEVNFTLVGLGEFAGFLQVPEGVKPLAKVVKDETVNLGIRIGCLKCLGVIGTPEALNAILESQVRIGRGEKREIPTVLVEALETACMAMRSYEAVWSVLRDPNVDGQIREACAHAIQGLSELTDGPLPPTDEIIALLKSEGRELPGYDQLVLCLWRFDKETQVMDFLRDLAKSDHQSAELTRALALTGLLKDFPARIEELGIHRADERWVAPNRLDQTATLALLSLYRTDPLFEPAMRQALGDVSAYPALRIMVNLRSTDNVTPGVRQALWERTLEENGPKSLDRYSLEAVAKVWPDKLLEEDTIEKASQWASSARLAYVKALRTVFKEHGRASAVARVASQFLVDNEGNVRRYAAWLTRDTDSAVLEQAVDRFAARAEELDHAVFMLDAAFWLKGDWGRYEALGRSHREPLVRDIARDLSKERKQGTLAREYLPIVLDSKDLLETWSYGQALLELGNEETVAALYAGLPAEVYRRSYLIWLAKKLEKSLEGKRKDQSEKRALPPRTQ